MSPVSDVLSRIHDIQNTIAQLRGASTVSTGAAASGSGAAANATSASAFAEALGVTGASSASGSAAAGGLATTPSVDAVKGAVATGSGASGADVVAGAKKYLGVPYVFGGESSSGMDCSGLVQRVFADLGVSMPRVVPDQAKMGAAVPSLAEAKPGDLLVPKGEGHIVIYIGDGKVLHAPRPGKDVQIVDNWYKDSDLTTIRRIVPGTLSAPTASGLSGLSAPAGLSGTPTSSSQTDMMTAALKQLMSSGVAS